MTGQNYRPLNYVDSGSNHFDDYNYLYGRRKRETDEGQLGSTESNFSQNPKFIIALPQPNGAGNVDGTGLNRIA